MPALWKAVLRFAAEWVVLILLGGALGLGLAHAVRVGWVSERTIAVGYGVLITVVVAFMLWAVRDVNLLPWDDWDDDLPAPPDP